MKKGAQELIIIIICKKKREKKESLYDFRICKMRRPIPETQSSVCNFQSLLPILTVGPSTGAWVHFGVA
uniref:Transcription and mRNA export factor SUS1 n=1 Tax=Rhizophora mucronata TaxID=61149 RepID=A0A2P2K9X3_RHIMU